MLWNEGHDFVSFGHTADNANLHGFTVHFVNMMEFLAGQLGVFGPILFIVLAYLLAHIRPLFRNENYRMLLCFILPFLAVIILLSLLSRAHANWAAPIYIPATILVVSWALRQGKQWIITTTLALHLLIAGGFHLFDTILKITHVPLSASYDPFRRVRGWETFGAQVTGLLLSHPNTVLVSDERKVVAQLMYLLRLQDGTPYTVLKWNADHITQDHYDLTTDLNAYKGYDMLFITRSEDASKLFPYFTKAEPVAVLKPEHYDDPKREFDVYYLTHFKGY